MKTVSDIFDLWPSAAELARDIGLKRESHATVMKHRGSIPVAYWPQLIDAAARRGIVGVTFEALAMAHAGKLPIATSPDSVLPAVCSTQHLGD
jgi:hypothetical protein